MFLHHWAFAPQWIFNLLIFNFLIFIYDSQSISKYVFPGQVPGRGSPIVTNVDSPLSRPRCRLGGNRSAIQEDQDPDSKASPSHHALPWWSVNWPPHSVPNWKPYSVPNWIPQSVTNWLPHSVPIWIPHSVITRQEPFHLSRSIWADMSKHEHPSN